MSRYLFPVLIILGSILFAGYIAGGIFDSLQGIAHILAGISK